MSINSDIDSYLTCSYIHTPLSAPIKYQEVKINTQYFPFSSISILVKAIHNAIQTRIEISFLSIANKDQFAPIVINIPGGTVSNFIVLENTSQTSFRLWVVGRLNGLIRFNFKPDILDPKQIIYKGLKLFEDRKLDDADFPIHIEFIEANRMLFVPKHCLTPTIIDIMHGPERELSIYKTLEIPKYVRFSFFPGLMSFTGSSVSEPESPKHNITSILELSNGNRFLFWLRDYKRIHIWDLQTYDELFSMPLNIAINHTKDTQEYKDLNLNQLRANSMHSFIDNQDPSTFYVLIAYENLSFPFINIFSGKINDSISLDQNYWECNHLVKWANWDSETNSTSMIQDIHLIHESTPSSTSVPDEGPNLSSKRAHLLKIWILIEKMNSPFVFSIDIPLDQYDLADEYESVTLLNFNNPTVYFDDIPSSELDYSFDMNLSIPELLENFIDKLFRPYQFSFSTLITATHQYIDIINGKEEATQSEQFFIQFIKSKLVNFISPCETNTNIDTQDITCQIEMFVSICKRLEKYIKAPRKIIVFKELINQMALVGIEYIGIIRSSHQIEYINSIISSRINSSAIFKICSNSSNTCNILLQGPCKQKALYSFIESLSSFNRFIRFESSYLDVVIKLFESNFDESHYSLIELYSSSIFYASFTQPNIYEDPDFQSVIRQLAHKIRNNFTPIQDLIDLINIFESINGQSDSGPGPSAFQRKPNQSSISFETSFLSNTSYQVINSGFEISNILLWFLINCKAFISNQLLDNCISKCINIHIKYIRLYQLLSYPIQRFSIGSTSSFTSEFTFPYTSGPLQAEYYQTISSFVPTTIPSILDGFINLFEFEIQSHPSSFNSSLLTSKVDKIILNLDLTKVFTDSKSPNMAFILLQWLCYHHKSPQYTLKFLSTLNPHPAILYFMGSLEAKVYGDKPNLVKSFQKASICDVKFYPDWADHPLQYLVPNEYFERGPSGYFFFLAKHFEKIGYYKLASEFYRKCLSEFDHIVQKLLHESSNNASPRSQSQSIDLKSQDNSPVLRISQNIIHDDGTSVEFNRNTFIYLLISCYNKLKMHRNSINYLKELKNPRRKFQLIYEIVLSLHQDNNLMQLNLIPLEDHEWDFIQTIKQLYHSHGLSIQQKITLLHFLQSWYLKKHDWEPTISALIDQIVISIKYSKNTLGISIVELKNHVKLWKKVIKYFKRLPKDTSIEVNYFYNTDTNGWNSEPRKLLFTIYDAIKQHQKSIHRLKLANMSHIALDPLKLNSCQEFVSALVENDMLYRALDFSIYHQLDLTPIIRHLTEQVIRNPAFPPNRFLSPDPSNFFKAILLILERSYLPGICYFKDSPKYDITVKHYASVIETLISSNHHQSIPPRLSSFVRNSDFNLLLTIYCKYEITKEVGELAIEYMENIPLPKSDDMYNKNKKMPLPLETIWYVITRLKSINMTIGIGEELEKLLLNHLSQLEAIENNFKKLASAQLHPAPLINY